MLGAIRLLLTSVGGRVFAVVPYWMFMALFCFLFLLTFEKEIRRGFVTSWLGVSGMVFFWVVFEIRFFLVASAVLLIMMGICFGNVPFLILLRFVKTLSFMIS